MSLSAGREEQQTPAGAKMSLFHERQRAGPPFNSSAAVGPVGKLCVDVAAVVYTAFPFRDLPQQNSWRTVRHSSHRVKLALDTRYRPPVVIWRLYG